MPQLQFGLSSYERTEGDLPGLPVINQYGEDTASEGIVLQSRPGLSDRSADMGSGPVEQLFLRDLVLSSALYGVSGGLLYNGTTAIGAISGSGFCSIAGNEIGLMATKGSSLYFYDGTTLAPVAFPDSADVAHVSVGGSRYWMVRKDTGKIYWTSALASTVDALDFATAESLPDRALQTLWIDGSLIIFGSESVEFWQQTGNADLPITPLINMVLEKGLKATGCACAFGSSFAFVTNDNQVCLQNENNIVSNAGLEARIAASSECRLFPFQLGGDEFLCLRLDTETQVYNRRTGLWSEFQSYGQANWLPQCFAAGVFGSGVDGKTYEWGSDYTDAGGVLERRFRAGFPLNSGGLNVTNLQLRANAGQTPFLTGDYAAPQVEMRVSRDGGQTWGAWRAAELGAQGDYRQLTQWRALGLASRPGFLCEFRCTDPVPFRASAALINENWGGR